MTKSYCFNFIVQYFKVNSITLSMCCTYTLQQCDLYCSFALNELLFFNNKILVMQLFVCFHLWSTGGSVSSTHDMLGSVQIKADMTKPFFYLFFLQLEFITWPQTCVFDLALSLNINVTILTLKAICPRCVWCKNNYKHDSAQSCILAGKICLTQHLGWFCPSQ